MKKHIAIIGGGIAGLSAAAELLRHDRAVTVFEAKERLGGRAHTIDDGGLPIELGAEFLHGENRAVANALRAAGLSTHEVPDRNQLAGRGRFQRVKLWDRIGKIIERIEPRGPDKSFQDFLDQENFRERDRRLALGFVTGFHAADPRRISAHGLLRGEAAAERMDGAAQSRVNEGYSALVGFLEQDVRAHGGNLVTGTAIRSVRWRRGRVELAGGRRGSIDTFAAAIITLPLGVLKAGTIRFTPALVKKREAIDGLQFGNVIKVILRFRDQWWKNFGFIHAFDAPIPTWWTDPRGLLLTGWAGGPKADALLDRSPEELEALALKILARIFSERPAALRALRLASHTHNWARDPHVRGAYSYLPVNGLDLPKLLAAPIDGTLFFAGEATVRDAQMGTVFGAFESGLRAGREVLAA
jgi:monoamine oxidase